MVAQIARWGEEFVVGTDVAADGYSSVAALGVTGNLTGRFVVVYGQATADAAGVGDVTGIVGQLYNSDGTPNGGPFLVNSTTDGIQTAPHVVDRVNDQGFAVAFTDFSNAVLGGTGTDVRMRLFDVNGVASGNDFTVIDETAGSTNQNQPAIARVGTYGTIMVACGNLSPLPGDVGDNVQGIRARAYSNADPITDNLVVTDSDPHTGETNVQTNPSITELPATGFLVTWTDNLTAGFGNGTDIRGQLYSQLGVAIGTEFDIAHNDNRVLSYSSSAGLQNGDFVVAWTQDDDPSSAVDDNVYARIFTSPGNGGTPFLLDSDTAVAQQDVALAAYGTDQFVAVWTQNEGGGHIAIDARIFNSDGTPASTVFTVTSARDLPAGHASVAVLQEVSPGSSSEIGTARIVVTWKDASGIKSQIIDPGHGAQGIDFYGSDNADTYTTQYHEHVLFGNGGADMLTGGSGPDTFVFVDGFGNDTITDFSGNDTEKIDLSGVSDIHSFADLVAIHLDDHGTFVTIVDGADSIRLDGVTINHIGVGHGYSADDFIF